jgi:hypothetical protein
VHHTQHGGFISGNLVFLYRASYPPRKHYTKFNILYVSSFFENIGLLVGTEEAINWLILFEGILGFFLSIFLSHNSSQPLHQPCLLTALDSSCAGTMAAKPYDSGDEFEATRSRRSRRSRASFASTSTALESEDTGSDDEDEPLQVRRHSRVRRSISTVSSVLSCALTPTPPEPAAQERKLLATRFARYIHVSMYTFLKTLASPQP